MTIFVKLYMDSPFLLQLWALSLRESSSLQNLISQLLEIYIIRILVKKRIFSFWLV